MDENLWMMMMIFFIIQVPCCCCFINRCFCCCCCSKWIFFHIISFHDRFRFQFKRNHAFFSSFFFVLFLLFEIIITIMFFPSLSLSFSVNYDEHIFHNFVSLWVYLPLVIMIIWWSRDLDFCTELFFVFVWTI